MQHGLIRERVGVGEIALFQLELGLEYLTFRFCKVKFRQRYDFARAFPDAHITDTELAGIAPVVVILRSFVMCRDDGEVVEHAPQGSFSDP